MNNLQTLVLAGPLVGPVEHLAAINATRSRQFLRNHANPIEETGGDHPIGCQRSMSTAPLGERAGQPHAERSRPTPPRSAGCS